MADKQKQDRPTTADDKPAADTAQVPPVLSKYENDRDVDRDSVDEDKSNLGKR